jgi:hypothetical protein
MAAQGELDRAQKAVRELSRYFDWVKEGISPEERGWLLGQIQTLLGRLKVLADVR